jgi:ssDNA-binding Zn-finger/Zn-ribbon topoisomerase 1
VDISPKAQNNPNKIYKPHESQEETPKCDASVLRRRNKTLTGGRGWETLGRKQGWGVGKKKPHQVRERWG